jgi:Fe-S oxidoreductase
VLGREETFTGDPPRRAGIEMLYQMQALQVIEILKNYGVRKIITTCRHCYNIFRNEYPILEATMRLSAICKMIADCLREGRLRVV